MPPPQRGWRSPLWSLKAVTNSRRKSERLWGSGTLELFRRRSEFLVGKMERAAVFIAIDPAAQIGEGGESLPTQGQRLVALDTAIHANQSDALDLLAQPEEVLE